MSLLEVGVELGISKSVMGLLRSYKRTETLAFSPVCEEPAVTIPATAHLATASESIAWRPGRRLGMLDWAYWWVCLKAFE